MGLYENEVAAQSIDRVETADRRQYQVEEAISDQREAIQFLAQAVDELEKRLAPVTKPNEEVAEGKPSIQMLKVPHAEDLDRHTFGIKAVRDQVVSILDRLEI